MRLIAGVLASALLVASPAAAARKAAPIERAKLLVASGKPAEAVELLRAALVKKPKDAALHHMLAELLIEAGRHREALVHAQESTRLKPREPRFRYTRGLVLAEQGRFAEALQDFDFAIAQMPNQAPIHLERGAALLSLGRGIEARADWAAARRLDPSLLWTDWHEGRHDLIDGNNGMAIRRLATVALLQPDFAAAQTWLSAAYLLAGMPYRPRKVEDPWVNRLLDFHAGRLSFAELHRAASADPQRVDGRRIGEALLHYGLRLQRDGLLQEARAAFVQAARTQAPRHPWKVLAETQAARP